MAFGGEVSVDTSFLRRPILAQYLRLLQHQLRRSGLLVWRITVLSQDALHQDPHVGSDVLPHRPVDRYTVTYGPDQFLGDQTATALSFTYRASYNDTSAAVVISKVDYRPFSSTDHGPAGNCIRS